MNLLSISLFILICFTAILIVYLTKQFQRENLNYFNKELIQENSINFKGIEKEKVVAETLNGRFAMIGLIAAMGAYFTTGQLIPGFV